MDTGAGPWATAGVELGVVAGPAVAAADSEVLTPATSTSGHPPLGLLSLPARSTGTNQHVTCAQQHCLNTAYQVARDA